MRAHVAHTAKVKLEGFAEGQHNAVFASGIGISAAVIHKTVDIVGRCRSRTATVVFRVGSRVAKTDRTEP
jgi:hypothetical protein